MAYSLHSQVNYSAVYSASLVAADSQQSKICVILRETVEPLRAVSEMFCLNSAKISLRGLLMAFDQQLAKLGVQILLPQQIDWHWGGPRVSWHAALVVQGCPSHVS